MRPDRSCPAATARRAARSRRESCAVHPRSSVRRGYADWYTAKSHPAGSAGRAREIDACPVRARATANRRTAPAIVRQRTAAPPTGGREMIAATGSCDLGSRYPVIAAALEFQSERLVAGLQYPSARQDMHLVRLDVVEQTLGVGGQHDGAFGIAQGIHPRGHHFQRIDIETGIRFVQDREL